MSDENFGLSSEARARIRIALATAVINARAKKVNDVDRLSATNDHLIAAGRSRSVLPLSPPSPQDFRLDPRQRTRVAEGPGGSPVEMEVKVAVQSAICQLLSSGRS